MQTALHRGFPASSRHAPARQNGLACRRGGLRPRCARSSGTTPEALPSRAVGGVIYAPWPIIPAGAEYSRMMRSLRQASLFVWEGVRRLGVGAAIAVDVVVAVARHYSGQSGPSGNIARNR